MMIETMKVNAQLKKNEQIIIRVDTAAKIKNKRSVLFKFKNKRQ